ncbi:MAG: hypothetical protein ACFE9Z_13225 [Promethearchaeota archaeon]
MKFIKIVRSRIFLFIIQFFILSLIVIIFGYRLTLVFDILTTVEQAAITQFLANLVLFNNFSGLIFIYIIWFLVSLIPIFIYVNYKKAYSMNLITFFLPNFFFYLFLSRYSEDYFNTYFQFHILHTVLLGILIACLSILLSIVLKKIIRRTDKNKSEDIDSIAKIGQMTCPNCGIKFESIPKYCYKCNSVLVITEDDV